MCLLVPTKKGISVKEWQRIEVVEKDAPAATFEPIELSSLAYQICKTLVSMRPDHVLIERQRHRTGGASAILEWTIRVNTFEAMIHAILHTLIQESKWSGRIESVHPKRISDYWIHNRAEKSTSHELKLQKIGIVTEMIRKRSSNILFEGCAQETVEVFVGRPKGKRDDIADSFLQGITWIRWQQAKLRVKARLKKGEQVSANELSALLK
ncbi:Cruciform cutting endonuclease 1, mitochondrial [Neolecta irregularis DAH-3]|uniref:Cruciform cutting endonuclease 1, mitochondrial n=1 Tax=Neolecta irregularis (strain DAH-3) TaxID=1198029 RepID=A0A1U7LKQ2_NEOID|nr:Cruciform cutting endonuclease 1, mitochondrial [Neolecta irregularis DAH-3]|eukprot:OLL23235.1 Cruciform cutting endonuclease 1, mitochondrial [Neolecta irregularis DAH-3]